MNKHNPMEVAQKFVHKYFPNCNGALLAGSVVRGEATNTSDLDIVIFDDTVPSSYRESFIELDWPIEVFVHNASSYKPFFESDRERARPSLPRMVSEGIILRDDGVIESIKKEAAELLNEGPEKWSEEIVQIKRYFLTDTLDDFIGCSNRAEEIFIANTLAELLSEFVLRTNHCWIGTSKWIVRSLLAYDEDFTNQFVEAFDTYYKTGDKGKVIHLVEVVMEPFGGRLFEGFSIGK
ncbi:nucleotidyltransferase domain-containing protein [Psychrobacillus sp. INOP01]|uniref:nucleotidyltransferase domain-containing protein n=1 Tax=Psychrobacillus sp. INOP01 TaxID=2829187 RepID=UPI001BAD2DE6|nr:nucleotidyltransferase domain-containing protein [Psychrobacillus sp. INOP01]QUG43023.1 nucleotidyltransferase domain-containing protein [Psychrobacillus sp. INOP01]